ncbi:MAG: helix-hairpin-helix domain-containing protein [Proteobacteria bacterium]|nr:helix-hairpin-helix domain-containing protein [Pseudomonadota bacterium]MBU1389522.1 helix-hairpin-helix domain-containing protein [Pseudomonadota bacterium]MBU1541342.1 helix-hairpin-helix domain-containing protein [Pseudomonadota bacterium]MBU2430602.1 helix-hairpin-helix domain-containing protein [Pseudomonadota bacterium]MBU2482917.1 helix-hairpin-helix domain-containing protein [Pseudomonadota bacterium]
MKLFKKTSVLILVAMLFVVMIQPVMASKGKVNINTAAKNELLMLKHVGDKIADKIIEYRKENPFQKPEDIMQVKGIGEKVFEANKDIIVVKD